ncbi:hypothetical protein SAMN05444678_105215 [Sphingomonas sp. YR710]|uniref:hypothetical protein n=1 Tax=Sphingomonas sp. YR710 TaxID=1882773 RepID=UPI0008840CAE|nr:hypothetical protein [Sphingomonas sp. YR710]SDC77999.1 hypothetical protein SAMN05444678_105215 [Sphingomonas sp. YR710]
MKSAAASKIAYNAQGQAPGSSDPVLRDRDLKFRRPVRSAAEQILEIVDRERPSLVTLDVFDTVLWRPSRVPADIFSLVGTRLFTEKMLRYGLGPEQFSVARRQAEHRLRLEALQQGRSPEIGLIAVYSALQHILATDSTTLDEFISVEVEVERKALQPDYTLQQVLSGLRARNIPHAYCSDTYFTATELKRLLKRADPTVDKICIASSHDEGSDKAQGLLSVVAARCGIAPTDILHIGDNLEADTRGAKRVGAPSIHLPQFKAIAREFFEGEEQAARLLGLDWADFPVRCGIDAIRRQVWNEVIGLQRKGDLVDELGLLTVGPLLTAFAEWTLEQAEAAGIEHLLCLTREGMFLSELINIFADQRGSKVKAIPFLTSRTVTYPTLFTEGDMAEFQAYFFSRRTPMTAASFLARAGSAELVSEVPAELRHVLVRGGDPRADKVLEALVRSAAVRAAVTNWSIGVQDSLARYVSRVAAESDVSSEAMIGMVDLGWTTRSQTVLRKAMERLGWTGGSIGFYLATDEAAAREVAEGSISRGFLFEMGAPRSECRVTLRCKEILEQVCSADVGSVVGYDMDGAVIFDPARPPASQHRFLAGLRGRVRDFCHAYQAMLADNKGGSWCLADMAPALRVMLARLTVCPTERELTLIGNWVHDENNGSESSETICDPYFLELVRYATLRQIHSLPVYWVFGLLKLARPQALDSLVLLSRGGHMVGDDHWHAARLQFFTNGELIEDLAADYFIASDGVGISYATFHHAGCFSIRWFNYGSDGAIRIERVLVGSKPSQAGAVLRTVYFEPANILRDGETVPGAVIVSPGMSVEIMLPILDGLCETSLILCLRRVAA